jgi:hypothetical protein
MSKKKRMGSACRLLPHGGYTLIPTVMATMAWLSSLFQDGCDYAIVKGPIVQTIADDDHIPWLEVGFAAYRKPYYDKKEGEWMVGYTRKCQDYPTELLEMDAAWKSAKGFAFLALVLGGGGALFLWFSGCCVFSKATWRMVGFEVLLAGVFQCLAFLWFQNSICHYKNQCTLSFGSKADIVAAVFWMVSAAAIFYRYPVPQNLSNQQRETTQPEISLTGPDGAPVRLPSLQGSAEVAAALPLEGDATATLPSAGPDPNFSIDDGEFSGGKDLNDVEVL